MTDDELRDALSSFKSAQQKADAEVEQIYTIKRNLRDSIATDFAVFKTAALAFYDGDKGFEYLSNCYRMAAAQYSNLGDITSFLLANGHVRDGDRVRFDNPSVDGEFLRLYKSPVPSIFDTYMMIIMARHNRSSLILAKPPFYVCPLL